MAWRCGVCRCCLLWQRVGWLGLLELHAGRNSCRYFVSVVQVRIWPATWVEYRPTNNIDIYRRSFLPFAQLQLHIYTDTIYTVPALRCLDRCNVHQTFSIGRYLYVIYNTDISFAVAQGKLLWEPINYWGFMQTSQLTKFTVRSGVTKWNAISPCICAN